MASFGNKDHASPPPKRRKVEGNCGFSRETELADIDEVFYSRQLYVLGHDAMRRMLKCNVLISGLGGLGVEIAKNVVLGGVKSVTLHDNTACSVEDLASQFFLSRSDIGKNRAEASLIGLSELNSYVTIESYNGALTDDFVKAFDVVVLTDKTLEEQLKVSSVTHDKNIPLIVTSTKGIFAQVFCDFGESFEVVETTEESQESSMIANVSRANEGVVTCFSDCVHGLGDGDFVTFSEVEGMTELNSCGPKQVRVISPYSFSIGSTTQYSEYSQGGVVEKVEASKIMSFKSLSESLKEPEFVVTDFGKVHHTSQLHLAFKALHSFSKSHSRDPRPWNSDDRKEFIEAAILLNQEEKSNIELDVELLGIFSSVCSGSLCPMNSVIGGIVAQEVMKACSGKFVPIFQWLYFDAVECLPLERELDEMNCQPTDSRYDGQVAIFGKEFQNQLGSLKYFVVGAGSIGCELLKNLAMMGVGEINRGEIVVADMDVVAKSDLNRQFIYRSQDIGRSKASIAAIAIRKMNPNVNIFPRENRVDPDSEDQFNDDFFENIDGVAVALDNLESRKYLDRRCVYYRKPLLESGILGTKGSTQVVVPFLTESFSCSKDPSERNPPECTVKRFPKTVRHTLLWARDIFDSWFHQSPKNASSYLEGSDFFDLIVDFSASQTIQLLETLTRELLVERPQHFEDCVTWARDQFEKQFSNKITKLVDQFPPDALTVSGAPFWGTDKRCPTPLTFSKENQLHLDFICAAANLRAKVFGIAQSRDMEMITRIVQDVNAPQAALGPELNTNNTPSEMTTGNSDEAKLVQLLYELPHREQLGDLSIAPLTLDVDDDSNFHMDFIEAASNLRASNYGIAPINRHSGKLIAGNIIPTIATTASVVAGLTSLELIKVAQGIRDKAQYKNGFVNLALPFFDFSEPLAPWTQTYNIDNKWTVWDRFEISGELSLIAFIEHFKNDHGLVVNLIYHGSCVLFSSMFPRYKLQEILNLPMSEVLRKMSGKVVGPRVRSLAFNMFCSSLFGNDVEVPYVRYVLPTTTE